MEYNAANNIAALIKCPVGIAVTPAGDVIVSDSCNDVILRIDNKGLVYIVAGLAGHSGFIDGIGAQARFAGPSGIALDKQGNIYVADTYNQSFRMVSPTGKVCTLDESDMQLPFKIFNPEQISTDGSGAIYVTVGSSIIKGVPKK